MMRRFRPRISNADWQENFSSVNGSRTLTDLLQFVSSSLGW